MLTPLHPATCSEGYHCKLFHVSTGQFAVCGFGMVLVMFCVTSPFRERVPSAKVCGLHAQVRCRASLWQVSSHGRVRCSYGEAFLGSVSGDYRRVNIAGQSFLVHRLVARAFLDSPSGPDTYQVNHIDGDGNNNRVENLQYVTPQENIQRSYITSPDRGAKPGKPVFWREEGTDVWYRCSTQAEATRLLGLAQSSVSSCCRGVASRCYSKTNRSWLVFKYDTLPEPPRRVDEDWQPARYPGQDMPIRDVMVSSHGRLFWNSSNRNGLTRGTLLHNGYYGFQTRGLNRLVHRSVAATFLGPPESPIMQVNHKDGDRRNNHVRNLEFVTPSQNMQHFFQRQMGAIRRRRGRTVLTKLAASDDEWTQFKSIRAAGAHTGLTISTVRRPCDGIGRDNLLWNFRFAEGETHDGEEWRTVILEGARSPR